MSDFSLAAAKLVEDQYGKQMRKVALPVYSLMSAGFPAACSEFIETLQRPSADQPVFAPNDAFFSRITLGSRLPTSSVIIFARSISTASLARSKVACWSTNYV
jgi:hypothetical protein